RRQHLYARRRSRHRRPGPHEQRDRPDREGDRALPRELPVPRHAAQRIRGPGGMSEHHHHDHHEPHLPPSRVGTVVLDIGDGVGALVVHAPAAMCGIEIEIAFRGETDAFTHTEVRERRLPAASVYAGVFPALTAGDYTLLDADAHRLQDLTIRSGQVTE